MINNMRIKEKRHERLVISKEKDMVKKMLQKKKKDKNDKFPRARDWTLTTDRNMVRSDALPTELRGTCQLILKSYFKCPAHRKS